jgi:hypothetical protein
MTFGREVDNAACGAGTDIHSLIGRAVCLCARHAFRLLDRFHTMTPRYESRKDLLNLVGW